VIESKTARRARRRRGVRKVEQPVALGQSSEVVFVDLPTPPEPRIGGASGSAGHRGQTDFEFFVE
jgi:hypothetical protein